MEHQQQLISTPGYNPLAIRVLPLSRQLFQANLIDEDDRAGMKELAFARDPELELVLRDCDVTSASMEELAESLKSLLRARRAMDGRLHHRLQQVYPQYARSQFLHRFLEYHWENFISVLWFRVWDMIFIRLVVLICRRFPSLAWLLEWLVVDPR